MSIHAKSLSYPAFQALEALCANMEWPDLRAYVEPNDWALLVARLKHVPDSEDVFPRGKWATIQQMTMMLDDWCKSEVAGRRNG